MNIEHIVHACIHKHKQEYICMQKYMHFNINKSWAHNWIEHMYKKKND